MIFLDYEAIHARMSKPRANKGQRGRISLDFYKVTPTFLSTIKVNLLQFLIFPLWPNPPQVIVGSLVTYQLLLAYKLLSFTTSLACVSCFQNVLWPLVLPILHPFLACSPFLSGAVGCTTCGLWSLPLFFLMTTNTGQWLMAENWVI